MKKGIVREHIFWAVHDGVSDRVGVLLKKLGLIRTMGI
jgi:hypothetical protein